MEKLGISEQLIEQLPDAVFGVDSVGSILFVNAQGEALFGWTRAELLGRPIESLVPEHTRSVHRQHRAGYFAEPVVRAMGAGTDLSARRKDGTEFPAEISLSSIETEDGLLVTAAVRDVTERKGFEAVVARARDTAERAARSRRPDLEDGCRVQDRLRIAAAAHKLKSPARSLGAAGFGDLLHDLEQHAADADWPTLASMVGRVVSQRSGLDEQLRAQVSG